MRHRYLLSLAILLAAACSSSSHPPTVGRPSVDVHQASALFFGSGQTAPLNLIVDVSNPAREPILLRRVRIQAGMGMTQYSVYPTERTVHETIAPGETKSVNLTATAFTDRTRLEPNEPLALRTILDYDVAGKRHQELYVTMNVGR
jgi:uncharacterized membrane protein YdfJ with MMPL/SSD domain